MLLEKPGQRCRRAAEKAGKAVWRGPQTALKPFVDRQAQDGRQPAGSHIDAAGKRCQPAPGQVKNKQRPVAAARAFRRQQQNDEQQRQHDLERILGSVQEQHVPVTKDIELVRQQDCQNGERGFGNAAAHAADQGIEQRGPPGQQDHIPAPEGQDRVARQPVKRQRQYRCAVHFHCGDVLPIRHSQRAGLPYRHHMGKDFTGVVVDRCAACLPGHGAQKYDLRRGQKKPKDVF